jgi:hypothetical protein
LGFGCVSAVDSQGRTIWIADAHFNDGKRFVVHADEKLSAFVELERQVLTVTFYLESIHPIRTGDALLGLKLAISQCFPANCLYGGRNRLQVAV